MAPHFLLSATSPCHPKQASHLYLLHISVLCSFFPLFYTFPRHLLLPCDPILLVTTISSSILLISRSSPWDQIPEFQIQLSNLLLKYLLVSVQTDLRIFSIKSVLPLMIPISIVYSVIYPLADSQEPSSHPSFLFLPNLPHLAHYQVFHPTPSTSPESIDISSPPLG